MARIHIDDGDGLERQRIWRHNADMGRAVGVLGNICYTGVSLDVRVREVARMRIAQINNCHI